MAQRISEVIRDLQKIKKEHGDVEVYCQINPDMDDEDNLSFRPVALTTTLENVAVWPEKTSAVFEIERS